MTTPSPLSPEEKRLLNLFKEPIYIIDADYNLLFINEVAKALFEFDESAGLAGKCYDAFGFGERCQGGCPLDRIIHSPERQRNYTVALRGPGAKNLLFEFDVEPLLRDDRIAGHIVFLRHPECEAPEACIKKAEREQVIESSLETVSIREIFNLEELERLVQLFADVHGVTSAIFDDKQELMTHVYNFSESCKMVRNTQKGLAACLQSDRRLLESAEEGTPCTLQCVAAGLMDAVSPIVVAGRRLGTWALGQVLVEGEFDEERSRAFAAGIGVDPDAYIQALRTQTRMSMDKMRKLSEFLVVLTQMLAKVGLQNFVSSRLYALLDQEKELLDVTLKSIADGVVSLDIDGRVMLMNEVAQRLAGVDLGDAYGRPLAEIFHLTDPVTGAVCQDVLEHVLADADRPRAQGHLICQSRTGVQRPVACRGNALRDKAGQVLGAVLVFQDISDQLAMEEELAKVQKMESVSVLAGGIAHDFNNLLVSILGNVNLAKLHCDPDDLQAALLENAEKASLRARDLTQQLLTFAKGGVPIKKMTSIQETIKETAIFAATGTGVRCSFSLPEDLWPLEADEGQISQVINNLVINACQAMPQGGVARIAGENITLDGEAALPLAPGQYVKITVEDRGVGIPKEHLKQIFDPFYTTKADGTGLGLAICLSIVRKHGGHLSVTSTVDKGTTFDIYLPASPGAMLASPWEDHEVIPGEGRILLMDDESAILEFGREALQFLGYEVDLAANGEQTLKKYRAAMAQGEPYDAVVMDLTIRGGMGGKDAARHLLEEDPQARIIASSGYSRDPVMAEFEAHGFKGVLVKPYTLRDLSSTLRNVIQA